MAKSPHAGKVRARTVVMDEAGLDYENRPRLKNIAAAQDMVLLTGPGVELESITVMQMRAELPVAGARQYLRSRQG